MPFTSRLALATGSVQGWSQSVRVQNTQAEGRVGLQPLPVLACLVLDALWIRGQ